MIYEFTGWASVVGGKTRVCASFYLPSSGYRARIDRVVPQPGSTAAVGEIYIVTQAPTGIDMPVLTPWAGFTELSAPAPATYRFFVDGVEVGSASLPEPLFGVWQRLGGTDCRIIAADMLVDGSSTRIFGPATRAACEQYVRENCGMMPTVAGDAGRPFPWMVKAPCPKKLNRFVQGDLEQQSSARRKVMQVSEVQLSLEKSLPPRLVVRALGLASSLNWKEIGLEAKFKDFPANGILRFALVGKAPEGVVLPTLLPVMAEVTVPLPEKYWVRGVVVEAEQNQLLHLWSDGEDSEAETMDVDASRLVCGVGVLEEGVECPIVVLESGARYSLSSTGGFAKGTEVRVCGIRMDASFCMEGEGHLAVLWIVAA